MHKNWWQYLKRAILSKKTADKLNFSDLQRSYKNLPQKLFKIPRLCPYSRRGSFRWTERLSSSARYYPMSIDLAFHLHFAVCLSERTNPKMFHLKDQRFLFGRNSQPKSIIITLLLPEKSCYNQLCIRFWNGDKVTDWLTPNSYDYDFVHFLVKISPAKTRKNT